MGELINTTIDGQPLEGYFAAAGEDRPAIIVIQEWWGLVSHIKNIVDRFAQSGFNAFAPDLYKGQAAAEPDTAKKLMMELELDHAASEISGAAKFLATKSSYEIGVVGFCMGGTLAVWSASFVPQICAAVAFYPGSSWSRHNPTWNNFAGKNVLFHCSEGDGTSMADGIQEALTKIRSAGGSAEALDYQNTQHAFFNDDRPEVYNQEAAEISWSRTLEFFKANLQKK